MHRFPKDETEKEKWIKAIPNANLRIKIKIKDKVKILSFVRYTGIKVLKK